LKNKNGRQYGFQFSEQFGWKWSFFRSFTKSTQCSINCNEKKLELRIHKTTLAYVNKPDLQDPPRILKLILRNMINAL
jgi:hypothetical protein